MSRGVEMKQSGKRPGGSRGNVKCVDELFSRSLAESREGQKKFSLQKVKRDVFIGRGQ